MRSLLVSDHAWWNTSKKRAVETLRLPNLRFALDETVFSADHSLNHP